MRQGNGSDLLGLKDSRSTKIGIIYVAPDDDRKSILAAILTQEKLGRKQIAIVLPENQPNKAFQRSQDFDDLKAVRRKLRAQLIFIAPAGPGPAEFARQRRFSVYSSLGSYADALGLEPSLAETRNGLGKLIAPLAGGATAAAPALPSEKCQSVPTASSAPNNEIAENASSHSLSPYIDRPTVDLTHVHAVDDLPASRADQPPSISVTDAQASPKSSVIIASSVATDIVAADLINKSTQQSITPDVSSTTIQDDRDALSPTPSTSSSQTEAPTVDTTPPPTLSSMPDTTDPAAGAEPGIIELLPSPRTTPDRATAKLPAAAATSTAQPSPHTPSQEPSAGRIVAIIDTKAPASVLYKATSGRSPALSTKTAQTAITRKRPSSRGLMAVVLIIAVLLICDGIISCASGQQLFGFGLLANGSIAPATITITPNSKVEQDSYVIQAVTGNADPTKRQISLRQLTFSPPKQSKSVTATGVGQIAARASGTLVFSNGSSKDFPLQAGTLILNSNGIAVTTDQFVDIPAGNPLNGFVATVLVPAHAADPGTGGNIGALTINQICCTSGDSIGVKNPDAFSGGKDAKNYSYLQQSDVDGIVNQLKPMLSQQAQNGLKGQIKPHEQLVNNPQCTTQPNADQPIGDQEQKVTTATITVNATCTGLAYDTGGAQILAQELLKRKAASDLRPNYVLKGTIMTKQLVTDVQDSVVTLQIAVAGTWYYQLDDNQQQTLAKQLVNKSRAAAQSILNNDREIAQAKIDLANGSTLPANPKQMSIRVQGVSGASPSDLPALPTVVSTNPLISTGGR